MRVDRLLIHPTGENAAKISANNMNLAWRVVTIEDIKVCGLN